MPEREPRQAGGINEPPPAGKRPSDEHLLIAGAAGGVGSILTQLARRLTSATVICTASRPETQSGVTELGAHHVIDHSKPLPEELKHIGIADVTHLARLTQTDSHDAQIVESLPPQGRLALIDDGVIHITVGKHFGTINAANLKRAHAFS